MKAKQQLQAEINEMQAQGSFFKSAKGEAPKEIIDTAGQLQCIIFQSLTVSVPDATRTVKTAQIGISYNNGINWYFIDASGNDIPTLRKYYPQLSSRLVIPKTEEKTMSSH
jgi:hypothetical protein